MRQSCRLLKSPSSPHNECLARYIPRPSTNQRNICHLFRKESERERGGDGGERTEEQPRKFRDAHKSERSITNIYLVLRTGEHRYGGFPVRGKYFRALRFAPRERGGEAFRRRGANGTRCDPAAAADKCPTRRGFDSVPTRLYVKFYGAPAIPRAPRQTINFFNSGYRRARARAHAIGDAPRRRRVWGHPNLSSPRRRFLRGRIRKYREGR